MVLVETDQDHPSPHHISLYQKEKQQEIPVDEFVTSLHFHEETLSEITSSVSAIRHSTQQSARRFIHTAVCCEEMNT